MNERAETAAQPTSGDTPLNLQRVLFAGPTPDTDADLYATVAGGHVDRTRTSLHAGHGTTIDTDTYFGRVPAAYFGRWTTLTSIDLGFTFETTGRAHAVIRGSDSNGQVHDVARLELEGAGAATSTVQLDAYSAGGSVWVGFVADDGELTIRDVVWSTTVPHRVRAAAVAICTFNRPSDCVATLTALASDQPTRERLSAVYVVDQGTDPVCDQPGFERVSGTLDETLAYIRQPNLGGAGGFTRGISEAIAREEDIDLILMDDDIRCEPETVLRLTAFAAVTPEPMIVGAQMLYLMNPTRLHVGAEYADLRTLRAGRWAKNALHDADMLTERQDRPADAGYNGWWTCLLPSEVITGLDLPLPMFFQWDDIEYGIRAARVDDVRTVTLPGAAVWHMDFSRKDNDDPAMYFSIRNSLITAALHSDLDVKSLSTRMFREISQYIVAMQYGLAHTMLRGIEDFLAGPDILGDGGRAAVTDIRRERAPFPETVVHPESDVPGVTYRELPVRPAGFEPAKDRFDVVLAKRAAVQLAGRVERGCVAIPPTDAHWWHVSLFDQVVVADASGAGVRLRTRDTRAARALGARNIRLRRRFRSEAKQAQQAYRAATPTLTSRENWQRLFTTE
ncbi:glycosyltransferase [Gordonia rubripertincta]|uniref:Glycosyltransferase n=1 Tax=Gordonia rubripertincta TaxID=36822 RepID=A0ABT4MSI0_GORRU|nr:glycosyltransferase [Gordonia rubripertincta]MCZ4549932.1 glycosyltransferase [Gordonia rubripertincta]